MTGSKKFLQMLIVFTFLFSCAVPEHRVCIKDDKEYCVTSDWIYGMDWDSCYRRGLSCMEGECWEYAISEFTQAISQRFREKRDARPYGMHFRDYFPHREMGICYLNLGEKENDLTEDDRDQVKKEIQDLTKKYETRANDLAKAKEAEVTEE